MTSAYDVRKSSLSIETIWHERGPRLEKPLLVGTAIAVIRNPFAGRYEPNLMPFQAALRQLGRELATRLIDQLGGASRIEAYGKGTIVGEDGELEHGAVWHEAGGQGMREVLGQPKAIVPAAKVPSASRHWAAVDRGSPRRSRSLPESGRLHRPARDEPAPTRSSRRLLPGACAAG